MTLKIVALSALFLFTANIMSADGYEKYTVKNGDTLPKIAGATLKDAKYLPELLAYNGITQPSQLAPGKGLKVPYSLSKNRVATVTLVAGNAKIKHHGKGLEALTQDSVLLQSDTIQTGDDAKVEIQLDEGSVVRVGPSTKFGLSSYAYNGDSRDTNMNLEEGNLQMKVTKLSGDSEFKVSTVTAVAGVRGTFFYVNYDSKSKEVGIAVFSGKVMVGKDAQSVKPGEAKQEAVAVPAGHAVNVNNAGKPGPIFEIPGKIEWAD